MLFAELTVFVGRLWDLGGYVYKHIYL